MTAPPYRGPHRAIRRALLPYAYGQLCHLCGQPMLPGQALDLDHRPDGRGYRGLAHSRCNRADGGRRSQLGAKNRRRIVLKLPALAVAAEVNWDRTHTAICVAGWDGVAGVWRVELVDRAEGTDMAGRLLELRRQRGNVKSVCVDPGSPASSIADALRNRVRLAEPQMRDVSTATGEFIDLLRAGEVKLADQPALTNAARHIKIRQTSAGIAFDRRGDIDPSPVIAASLALWAAKRLRVPVIR